jgi:molecular chaperone DnaJ
MANTNFYDILGVSENASDSEIKKAYRELAKKYHPDKHKGDASAEARFKEISEAYATLSDSKKRAQYDQMRRFGGGNFSGNYQNVNFEDLGDLFGGSFGSFRGRRTAGGAGLGDLFGDLFGGSQGFQQRPQKGQDISAELTVSFDVAIRGGKQMININGQKLNVNIPAGTESGKKIRLRGQGQPGMSSGSSGDLIITITVAPHSHFRRKGADIYSTVPVNMVQAALGSKVSVNTYDKGAVNLKIPAGTQNGKLFKLRGMGINVNGVQGDHFVDVQLTVPEKLDTKSQKTLADFAKQAGLEF